MSDRCYSSGYCRKQDLPRFTAVGYTEEEDGSSAELGIRIVDDQANYASYSDLAALATEGIPFVMSHDAGGEYPSGVNASDGIKFADCTAIDGDPVVTMDETGALHGLESATEFWVIYAAARKLIADSATAAVKCVTCHKDAPAATAHLHQGKWIGECCWDERLRSTE
jgi:hypothetical protein